MYSQLIYCADDGESRMNCNICDEFCIKRYYKNQLKLQTHTNSIYKKEQLKKDFKKPRY